MDKIYSLKFSPNVGLLRMNCDCATNPATKVKEIMLHFTNQRECGTMYFVTTSLPHTGHKNSFGSALQKFQAIGLLCFSFSNVWVSHGRNRGVYYSS